MFISYSRKDKKWLDRIQMHLKPLVRDRSVKVWSDANIKAGSDWRKELETALAQSKVAVLLVSASFLASDFVVHNELPALLDQEGVPVIWIPVSACLYESVGIDKYQAVLNPAKPLNRLHHAHVDEELVRICREIQKAFTRS
ncbi:toll/interleukin-1 receptor domain-containing protein [Pyxidicoccus parkwayensis]|uniref:Toll/interleukin-1 receptor domain-containing protein n=1 Tax=Pyxidicoccus parkwayensis TaxID=2813578 RepID=A0ABX7NTL9_9BACT|nr:toll/interleukin-1 receptor domain-containing protein [Pyxidicoccus parkwaysis]